MRLTRVSVTWHQLSDKKARVERSSVLKMEFGKRVTVVEYDVTSGSDNDDRDDDQSYIYCSMARPLSPGNKFRPDSDAHQPAVDSSDSDDSPSEMKKARIDDSPRSWRQYSESSYESASSCSDQEEESDCNQSDHPEPMPAASDEDGLPEPGDENEEPKQVAVLPTRAKQSCRSSDIEESDGNQYDHSEPMPAATAELAAPDVILISDDDALPGQDDGDELKQPAVAPTLPKQRVAYALRLTDLPPNLQTFMKETKSFFTRPHSLERHGQGLAASTFGKAEERVLCEYRSFYIIC